MIKSITFPEEGVGYIYAHIDEPEKPDRCYRRYYGMDAKEFAKEMGKWRREHKKWEKVKDQYKLAQCHENLAGKTFTFEPDKINIIFGPNGSGKSTILKALAGNASCTDGFSRFFDPIEFRTSLGEDLELKHVVEHINSLKINTCDVVWDGAPIYYDNFEKTEREGYGIFGGFAGDLMGDSLGDEIAYRQSVGSVSAGQKGMFLLSKILRLSNNVRSMEEILDSKKGGDLNQMNSTWKNNRLKQIEYFKQFEKYSEKAPYTFLFDELDKSLDIPSVYRIYTEFFPKFIKSTGCQVIAVSHSPLILSKQIYGNDSYNVISVDELYTSAVKEMLSNNVQF